MTDNAKQLVCAPTLLPSLHEQKMTNDAKVPLSAPPLLSSSLHKEGTTDNAKAPLLLPSCLQ
jgi:hypothetical protein